MTLRQNLNSLLHSHKSTWCQLANNDINWDLSFDRETNKIFADFVNTHSNCFDRSHTPGHVTGSALVLNQDMTKVLLTHHKKLGMWLQLGGHADGHHLAHEVAMTEATEESGLDGLQFLKYESDVFGAFAALKPLPFDLDCHLIPATSRDPEHYHFDVRFLIITPSNERAPVISEESHDVKWFTFEQARSMTTELSMHRQFSKAEWVKKILKL